MGRASTKHPIRCIRGALIGKELKPDRPEFLRNGYCHGCGDGPLHSVHNDCDCSWLRGRHRMCRACAIGYDYVTQGYTRIDNPPFTRGEWRDAIRIYDQGQLALRGLADAEANDQR